MKILFNDAVQNSTAPEQLKTPALSDTYVFTDDTLEINFYELAFVNCLGIGNCAAGKITIAFKLHRYEIDGGDAGTILFDGQIDGGGAGENYGYIDGSEEVVAEFQIDFDKDGLYVFEKESFACVSVIVALPKDTSIGRLAMGKAVNIPTAIAKQPGFYSTAEPRKTLSGQIVAGAGGYNYRALSLDSRYKIDREAMAEIIAGFKEIGMGYPFFIALPDESYKLPFDKLYATEKNQRAMSFESGVTRFSYSRRWEFEEAF